MMGIEPQSLLGLSQRTLIFSKRTQILGGVLPGCPVTWISLLLNLIGAQLLVQIAEDNPIVNRGNYELFPLANAASPIKGHLCIMGRRILFLKVSVAECQIAICAGEVGVQLDSVFQERDGFHVSLRVGRAQSETEGLERLERWGRCLCDGRIESLD